MVISERVLSNWIVRPEIGEGSVHAIDLLWQPGALTGAS
uniref:Uncharacterized protein n=1 Tax=Arundo donax TaxID=35708 RepID=A0A0A9GFH1_ARUDO